MYYYTKLNNLNVPTILFYFNKRLEVEIPADSGDDLYNVTSNADLKQGDALSPMLFNFALEYAIRRVHVNQDGLKLNGTHQLLAYADDVNILGGSIHTLKENAEALVAATREIGLEVSADKTKYMVMSQDRNGGRIHSVRIDNSTFEKVEEFKYLGTTLTNQD